MADDEGRAQGSSSKAAKAAGARTTGSKGASPLDRFEAEAPRARTGRGLRAALWTGLGVVVLAGGYVAAQVATADTIARGTTVAGVDIGGRSRAQAVEVLEAALAERETAPIAVTAGDLTGTLDPAAAGLALDAEATVVGLTGFSLDPGDLVRTLTGGSEVAPSLVIDETALATALDATAASLRTEPVDGAVLFVDGRVESVDATPGAEVDVARARDRVLGAYLVSVDPVDLPVVPVEPAVTQAETDAARELGTALVSAPVRVEVADQRAELPISVIGAAASFVATDGTLELGLDPGTLGDALLERTTDLEKKATDASFVFKDGKPTIKGGRSGKGLDRDALAAAVLAAGTTPGDRVARVELVETQAEESREKLEALGVEKAVVTFSTNLGVSSSARLHNLTLATKKVTGQLILPDEEWSLTEALSPITLEGGYRGAPVISNGRLQDGVGGGLSQMSTTAYNAFFLSGVDILEHRPHSFYFSRYPAGRESTIAVGSIDMRIRNDTPYGMLLQSWIKDGKLVVRIWSTPHYEVTTETSPRREVVQPRTVRSTAPGCIAQPAGSPGFLVTVTRDVSLDGEVVKDESSSWRYTAQNAYVCGPEPRPKASDDD